MSKKKGIYPHTKKQSAWIMHSAEPVGKAGGELTGRVSRWHALPKQARLAWHSLALQ